MQQFPQYGSRNYHSTNGKSLAFHRVVVLVLAVISFIFWSICIGVPAGLCFNSVYVTTHFNGFMLVVVNSAYIIVTFQIVSLITSDDFPTPGSLKSLRSLISLFLAATVIGIAVFISSTIHYANYGYYDVVTFEANPTAFGCSFSCFWNFSLLISVILYYTKCHAVMAKAATFGNGPSALEIPGPSATNPRPMTSNEAPQIQMLTESQQHQLQQQLQQQQQQQQQQNVILLSNNSQQGNYFSNRTSGSETVTSAPSFVYVPQNRET